MINPRGFLRGGALIALLTAAGCDNGVDLSPGARNGRASDPAAAIADCRQHADDVFLKQNRDILTQRDTRDSPFSSTGLIGITSAGLGRRYGHDEMVDRCIAASRSTAPSSASTGTVMDHSAGSAAPPSLGR